MVGAGRAAVLDDATPLDGPRIDIASRIGWLLRTSRLVSLDEPLALEELARRIGTNPTRVHRVETARIRSGLAADGYEVALGLPHGALRAPIDILGRYSYAPPDREPGPPTTSVRVMSELTERVAAPAPTGGDWLAWARALGQPGAIGLPEAQAATHVRVLVGELQRSVSHAYPSRYEALSLLRCSGYGHVVLDVVREVVEQPDNQAAYDLMSAVGEAPTPEAVAWCLDLLTRPALGLVTGGALALENMAVVTGPSFWTALVDPLLDLLESAAEDSPAHHWTSHLVRLVPGEVLAAHERRPRRALAPSADIPDWSRTRLNAHWSQCQARAHQVTEPLGLPDQPMLARLLFDIAMSPHESRAVPSYMFLGALPRLRRPLADHVAELADQHPDPVVRDRAGRRLGGMLHGEDSELAVRWLDSPSPETRDRAMRVVGAAGREVPEAVLRASLADDSINDPLYAAGMAAHPALPALAEDPTLPADVRAGARWWLEAGPRVVD